MGACMEDVMPSSFYAHGRRDEECQQADGRSAQRQGKFSNSLGWKWRICYECTKPCGNHS